MTTATICATVRQMRVESADVISLELVGPHGSALPTWEPGAHIDVHLPGGIVRQYSLCGTGESWRIAILREPASRGGSAYIHERLRPGDEIWLSEPRNNFALDPGTDYLFIAGGIGITPLISKIARATQMGASWRLLYGGRRRDSMALLDELLPYGDRVAVLPEDEYGLLPLREELSRVTADTSVHACGPRPLLEAVEAACAELGLANLHVERFVPLPVASVGGDTFVVNARRSGISVTVTGDESILEALEAAGLDPANSCREGICGTCETKVLAGTVDHRDSLLSDDEKEAGATMMICVSRGCGNLDLDI